MKFLNIEGLQEKRFGDLLSQALHLFLEPNQARVGGNLSCKDVHLTGFYMSSQCFAMLLWAKRPEIRQIPRNAIMCSTLIRAAPAVLPLKWKLADYGNCRLES